MRDFAASRNRITLGIEGVVEQPEATTEQTVDAWFVGRYILALIGIYLALVTPASVTIALKVSQLDPAGRATSLAVVSSLGAIAALFSNPIFGALSDRSTLRWGQRRPFIVGGVVVGSVSLLGIALSSNIASAAVCWAFAQVGFNAALASLVAILPQRIPDKLRGRVSGFMGMCPQVGVVGGTFLIQLVGTQAVGMFLVPALIGMAMVLPFVLTFRERPRTRGQGAPVSLGGLMGSMWITPIEHTDFALVWLGRFTAWTSLYLLTTYKTYFLIDHLGYTQATIAPILSLAMLVLAIAVAISSICGGWWSDRVKRRKPFVITASLLFAVAMALVAMSTSVVGFLFGIAIAGIGNGLYLGVDYALVSEVLPDKSESAGKGMGVFNMSATLPQTVAPLLAPILLRIGANGDVGNYTSLYLVAAVIGLLSAVFVFFVRSSR